MKATGAGRPDPLEWVCFVMDAKNPAPFFDIQLSTTHGRRPPTGMKMGAERSNPVLRQATRWPRPCLTQKGQGMITIPVITERCAGTDVGKRGRAAAVAVGPADREAEIITRWFAATMPALSDLHAWLREAGCTTVARESTGSWWISVKHELEDDLRITLVCPRKPHPKKGEKTDFRDAVDLAVHHRHGLLTGSFLPERGIVELRDLTRRRKKLLGNPGSEKNRIQKLLDPAGVKMGNVVSDVFGVSGQQILRSLPDKEALSAEQMADLAKKRLRNRIPELTEALRDHRRNDHHRWLIQQSWSMRSFWMCRWKAWRRRSTGTWSGTEGSTNCCRRYRVLKKPQRPVFWRKSERI